MSDCIVQTEFQGPGFVAVPNHVADDDRLSADALGVLVWMAAKPNGFTIRRATILKRFGMNKKRWQRIRRELIAAGAATETTVQDNATGRIYGSGLVVRWPEQQAKVEAPKPRSRREEPGDPKGVSRGGEPGDPKRVSRDPLGVPPRTPEGSPYKEQEEYKGARARARASQKPAPASRPERAGPVLGPETMAAYLLEAYPGETRADWLKRRGRTDEG